MKAKINPHDFRVPAGKKVDLEKWPTLTKPVYDSKKEYHQQPGEGSGRAAAPPLRREPLLVLPGSSCPKQETVDEVADATVRCLLRAVPATVPGIAFLSGGQPGELASARLNAMNVRFKGRLPWALSFSFARAIQRPALEIWRGNEANVLKAQKALYHRARCNQAARRGEYSAAKEGASA